MQLPLKEISELLDRSLALEVAYYFGSFAEGSENESSDLDIAVLCQWDKLPTAEKVWELRHQLADLAQRDIDLVILNDAGPILEMQVVTKGKVLIEKSPKAHALYSMRVFSTYAEFKEMIKPMEDKILERKFNG